MFTKNELERKKQLIFCLYNELLNLADTIENVTNIELYDKLDLLIQNFEENYSKLSNFNN